MEQRINKDLIPIEVTRVTSTLQKSGYEAYIVGGCVRDLLMQRTPKDWDITTNATPEIIQKLFEKTVYENKFGTVAVIFEGEVTHETCRTIEVTPFRVEGSYSDHRHPDSVSFSEKIEDDLKRRDFTVNAIAFDPQKDTFIDVFNGIKDIKDKILRAVGNPKDRFNEDALRILRAVRFSTTLGFAIEGETLSAIALAAPLLAIVSKERIRDEFIKIIDSNDPSLGIALLAKLGLLEHTVPELAEGIGCEQKGEHIYDVFEHSLHALDHAAKKNLPLPIRLSALFHDIGKPRTRRYDSLKAGGKGKYTFYGHEVVGAKMTKKILERLKFPSEITNLVTTLVRYHMFFSDTETISLSAVRRTIVNVGREHIWDLMQVRECDRVGMKKKEAPYRLRKYHAMIEEALRAPTSVSMLKINGDYMIKTLMMTPGRRMGWILHALLEECLVDDTKNTLAYLSSRAKELNELDDATLSNLGEKGRGKKEEAEKEELKKIRSKHGV
jgi:poly(A) polymerase/tRNA nucleotidyltransferase (CCA-adding enzyme)